VEDENVQLIIWGERGSDITTPTPERRRKVAKREAGMRAITSDI
jgi:hypothetical protein